MSTDPSLRALVEEQVAASAEKVDPALLERLLNAAESTASQAQAQAEATPVPPSLTDLPAAAGAALRDTFSLEEVGISATSVNDQDQSQTRALLAQSDTVMIDGRRRLRLQPAAREALLTQLHSEGRLESALQELPGGEAQDHTTRNTQWLQRCLRGQWIDPETASIDDLRAAVIALEQLQGLASRLNLPSLEEARRQLGLAEWLEPLRILVGAQGGALAPSRSDRFAGRAAELQLLRSHVDELASHSMSESVSRGLQWLSNKAKQLFGGGVPGVLMLEAGGGLGKSTLIAKFILDHARAPERPVPTVYLDFDRASLQPRQPEQLLREAMRQLALQFPYCGAALDQIARKLEISLSRADTTQTHLVELHLLFAEQLLRDRCLLLMLDTLEVVQPDSEALSGVLRFVNLLQSLAGSALRVVAAGRAPVPELLAKAGSNVAAVFHSVRRSEGVTHVLQPLSIREAQQMVERLGSELLGNEWQPAWSRYLAGGSRADPRRREPLALRVAVELVRAAEPDKRDALARSLENLEADTLGGFVGPLYQRRVLDHVRDLEVRKLAWPGLVLRRLTREIAREVLMQPCGIAPEQLDRVYDALAREVWIVTREGDALRHRPDLRSRTLPLMREYRDAQGRQPFFAINEAAIRYFAERRHSVSTAHAEWLYHRLLGGEPVHSLESEWSDALAPYLIDSSQDFPAGSDAHSFLLARTAQRQLAAERVLNMGVRDALEHLARTTHVFSLDDQKINPILAKLDLSSDGMADLPLPLSAARYALAVKTGCWRGLSRDDLDERWIESATVSYYYLLACHSGRQVDVPDRLRMPPGMAPSFFRDSGTVLQVLTYQLVTLSSQRDDAYDKTDTMIERLLREQQGRSRAEHAHLYRLQVTFGSRCISQALSCFVDLMANEKVHRPLLLPSDAVDSLVTIGSGGILRAFRIDIGQHAERRPILVSRADKWFGQFVQHLRSLLPLVLDAPVSAEVRALRSFMGACDPHWVLPMSYAAERLTANRKFRGTLRRVAERRLQKTYGLDDVSQYISGDLLSMMRLADQAGDLEGMTELLLSYSEGYEKSEDLRYLLNCYQSWKQMRSNLLDRLIGAK